MTTLMLIKLLLVGAGGFFGSAGRYLISVLLTNSTEKTGFPLGTFTANLVGCFLIGILAGLASKENPFWTENIKLLLITGFLGGFTTFSSFSLETQALIRSGSILTAGTYVGLSLILGIALSFTTFHFCYKA